MLQSLLFIAISGIAIWFAFKNFTKLRRNILLGKDEAIEGDTATRWKNVLLVALGQKKMFKNMIPAVFHFFIYAAFVVTQIELIEIFIDGVFGSHRFFADKLGGLYTLTISLIEILSALALIATFVFLARRNLLKVPRFMKPELDGFPRLDGNIILYLEIVLIAGIVCMNGADKVLQGIDPSHYKATHFAISSWLGPALFGGLSKGALVAVERFGWWLHISTVFAFLSYLPFSKHLHILLAFPNTYFAKLTAKGQMENMPEIMTEVKSMMGLIEAPAAPAEMTELPTFGSNDVINLSWRDVLSAYACTECGRCTSACPANATGKKLSPRKIMMDVRDRADEIGKNLDSGDLNFIREDMRAAATTLTKDNYDDGKSLFDRIAPEEIRACTTCNACVEACPILISPMDIILKLRRHEILTQSSGPSDWLPMFNSMENSGSPWAMSVERDAWKAGVE
jgi:heterodisulfide reductase subunit C/nitrate reductase gamma subunit